MNIVLNTLRERIINGYSPNTEETIDLYKSNLAELIELANLIKQRIHPENKVSYIIDRNVNLTNICYSHCSFCNFCVDAQSSDAYVLSLDEYREKIDELFKLGGRQLLLQGGMNPKLKIDFYEDLFGSLKFIYPELKLHALGPPEIVFLSKQSKLSYRDTLVRLRNAGLDSLPGAGAEILSERVKKIVSPAKCSVKEWLDVMREAHRLGFVTSATMMFGHIETIEERIEHLMYIRQVQDEKPINSPGFLAFIPWPISAKNTRIIRQFPNIKPVFASEYIRMIAISRIVLQNVPNIQASWLTVGKETGAFCLHAGANDLGSIMIEENVVSAAGNRNSINEQEIIELIEEQGFEAVKRNQRYDFI
jgi:cyclic dehypoxanthinyl futalosine synthase